MALEEDKKLYTALIQCADILRPFRKHVRLAELGGNVLCDFIDRLEGKAQDLAERELIELTDEDLRGLQP